MLQRRIPEWVRHAPTPGAAGFGILAACDAAARGSLVSVFPLLMYQAMGDAGTVALVFLLAGCGSLAAGLLTPVLLRVVPRRWTFTAGAGLYVLAAAVGILGGPAAAPVALTLSTLAAVIVFVCLNAYVLDYIAHVELGRCETLRLFYSALAWTAGPALGVWLAGLWYPAPFLLSGAAGLALLGVFWRMRLGNGRLIQRARAPAPNPLAYLGRFFAQPRLVSGWLLATVRSCGWQVYIVYLPIFAVQSGLGESVGGVALSLTNAILFASPWMLRWMQRRSVRRAVRLGFLWSSLMFLLGALAADLPWATVGLLFAGSAFLILLDISAGLPFLMAVKPSERTEMSAVYSIYRDVSAVVTPAVAWAVLLVAPVSAIFAVGGGGLFAAWTVAGRLHPRLGAQPRGAGRAAARVALAPAPVRTGIVPPA